MIPVTSATRRYNMTETSVLSADTDGELRPYVLRIRDLPLDEKPREKMLLRGASSLASHELLAIVLNTGTKKEGVLAMAERTLREYGPRSLSRHTNPRALAEDLDVPLMKALQIVACAELGRRFFERPAYGRRAIRVARDVFLHCRDMGSLQKEHLRGLYLNTHHRIIHDEVIAIGTINANIVHPREIFRPALEYAAAAVVLVHNHPSGSAVPSTADTSVTNQVIEAGKIVGIELLDHVIITGSSFSSVPAQYP
jgi:DNA repair protein RadC